MDSNPKMAKASLNLSEKWANKTFLDQPNLKNVIGFAFQILTLHIVLRMFPE